MCTPQAMTHHKGEKVKDPGYGDAAKTARETRLRDRGRRCRSVHSLLHHGSACAHKPARKIIREAERRVTMRSEVRRLGHHCLPHGAWSQSSIFHFLSVRVWENCSPSHIFSSAMSVIMAASASS